MVDWGLSFEEVVETITAYQEKPDCLCSRVDNLLKTAVEQAISTVVSLLNIHGWKLVKLELSIATKAKDQKKSIQAAYEEFSESRLCWWPYHGQRNNENVPTAFRSDRETFPHDGY